MANADGSDSKNVFIGIVQGLTSATVSIAILDNFLRSVVIGSFVLNEASPEEYLIETAHGIDFEATPDLFPVTAFLMAHVRQGSSVGVLVGAPKVIALPDEGYTPAAVFPLNSVSFKVLCLLPFQGLGLNCTYYKVPERESIVAHYVTPQSGTGLQVLAAQPRFLSRNILNAYGELLFDIQPSPEQSAAVAALIAKNHGAYYYWSSFGKVAPSSGDIIYCLNAGRTQTRVGSGTETLAMRFRTTREGLEDVPLEFALGTKKWEQLGENDASKAALIHVSKLFDFEIRCYSRRVDATKRDPRLVYPLPVEDDWIAAAIKNNVPHSGK